MPRSEMENQYTDSTLWILLKDRELGEFSYYLFPNYLDTSMGQMMQPLYF